MLCNNKSMNNKTLIVALSCIDSRSSGYIMRSALEYASEHGDYDYLVITPEDSGKTHSFVVSDALLSKPLLFLDKCINKLSKPEDGFRSPILSLKLVKEIKKMIKGYSRIIFHIHSLHHIPYSFVPVLRFIKKHNYPCVYTFHDVWPFTGGCYNFEQHGCNGIEKRCKKCAFGYKKASKLYKIKIKSLIKMKNLVIAPVSNYCKKSLLKTELKDKCIEVVNVETNVKRLAPKEDLRKTLGIKENEKVIISVCAYWCSLKGVEYIYELAKKLPKDYKLLIVGNNFDATGYSNIIHLPFLDNLKELPYFFNISDAFASVTQGDNFPLVLVEAQCCGVPVVGFGHGGTPEEVSPKSGLMVGTDNNVNKLVEALIDTCENHPFKEEDIVANGELYSSGINNKKYFDIYESFKK